MQEPDPYDDGVNAVIFKHEDYRQGKVIGPVWVRRGGKTKRREDARGVPQWFTRTQAEQIAREEGLPLAEV